MSSQKNIRLYIHTQTKKGEVHEISRLIEEMGVKVIKTDFMNSERDGEMVLRYTLDIAKQIKSESSNHATLAELIEAVLCHEPVRRVYEE